jgi:hypothetical protein
LLCWKSPQHQWWTEFGNWLEKGFFIPGSGSIGLCSSQPDAGLHDWPGFVITHRSGAYFHPTNYLLGAIIIPGNGKIGF